MSGARRLQTEIDRTLKKVEEGVEVFDEVWEKVYAAQQQNQKEKYEVDLKKEIKKLQRFRDQIKGWIASHEVKDKNDLTEARKLIESKMEMFKVCEKETKTKTYSKEGLARAERLDPEEQAKDEARNFLQGTVEKLSLQIEALEADVEKLSSGKKNKNKGEELLRKQSVIQKHLWHISKCEQIIRMIDNDAIETQQIEEIKDDIEYYVESGTDTEGMDELDPYENLNLEDIPIDPISSSSATDSSSSSSKKKSKSDKEAAKDEKARLKEKKAGTSLLTIGRAVKNKDKDNKDKDNKDKDNKDKDDNTKSNVTPITQPSPSQATSTSASQKLQPSPTKSSTPKPVTPAGAPASLASILKGNDPVPNSKQQQLTQQQQHLQQQQQQQLAAQQAMLNQQKQASALEQQRIQQASQQRLQQQLQAASQQKAMEQQRQMQQTSQRMQQQQQQSEMQQGSAFSGLMAGLGSASSSSTSPMASLNAAVSLSDPHTMALPIKSDQAPGGGGGIPNESAVGPEGSISSSHDNSSDGASEQSGGLGGGGGLDRSDDPIFIRPSMDASKMASALSALHGSLESMPSSHDRDRAKQYSPRNPFATPAAYFNAPGPSPVFDEAAIFEKFHTDTLFFIFYYQQGTYQQYLAARELKKQSWRFHKKYKTWFQRHEEPQVTTDEYEQGTYVYFDYQGTYDSKSGWCQRIKYDFTFEYEFLEDEL